MQFDNDLSPSIFVLEVTSELPAFPKSVWMRCLFLWRTHYFQPPFCFRAGFYLNVTTHHQHGFVYDLETAAKVIHLGPWCWAKQSSVHLTAWTMEHIKIIVLFYHKMIISHWILLSIFAIYIYIWYIAWYVSISQTRYHCHPKMNGFDSLHASLLWLV
jgi:hypothetical protein